jgi:hypothetical protein
VVGWIFVATVDDLITLWHSAQDPSRKLNELEREFHKPTRLVGSIPGTRAHAATFHASLAQYRVGGRSRNKLYKMTNAQFDAVTAQVWTNISEPSVQDLVESVSIVEANRRRPKVSRRDRIAMKALEDVELGEALRHAARASRAGLDRSEAHRLARAGQAYEITEIAAAAAEQLAQPEPIPQELLDDVDTSIERAERDAAAQADAFAIDDFFMEDPGHW